VKKYKYPEPIVGVPISELKRLYREIGTYENLKDRIEGFGHVFPENEHQTPTLCIADCSLAVSKLLGNWIGENTPDIQMFEDYLLTKESDWHKFQDEWERKEWDQYEELQKLKKAHQHQGEATEQTVEKKQ